MSLEDRFYDKVDMSKIKRIFIVSESEVIYNNNGTTSLKIEPGKQYLVIRRKEKPKQCSYVNN